MTVKNKTAVLAAGVAFGTGFFLGGKMLVGMINEYKSRMKCEHSNMLVLNDWLYFLYSGKNIEKYFHDLGYGKIMIYGNGNIGKRLFQALSKTDIEVVAIMDKTVTLSDDSGLLIGTDSNIPCVDCIIITPVFYEKEIYNFLNERTKIPVISIRDIVK